MKFTYKQLMKDGVWARKVCDALPDIYKTLLLAYGAMAAPTDPKLLRAKKCLETSMEEMEAWGCDV